MASSIFPRCRLTRILSPGRRRSGCERAAELDSESFVARWAHHVALHASGRFEEEFSGLRCGGRRLPKGASTNTARRSLPDCRGGACATHSSTRRRGGSNWKSATPKATCGCEFATTGKACTHGSQWRRQSGTLGIAGHPGKDQTCGR